MAIKETFRGNPSEKQYQLLTDFSGGVNSNTEDSLLKDNVARIVDNFDIVSGGLLSKRKGFIPLNIKSQVATSLNIDEDDLENLVIINSWNFNVGDKNIICLLTEGFILVNIVIVGSKIIITNKNILTDNAVIELYNEKPILIIKKDENVDNKISLLYSWNDSTNEWIDENSNANQTIQIETHKIEINNDYDPEDFYTNGNLAKINDLELQYVEKEQTDYGEINPLYKWKYLDNKFKESYTDSTPTLNPPYNEYLEKMFEGITFDNDGEKRTVFNCRPYASSIIIKNDNEVIDESIYDYTFDADSFNFSLLMTSLDREYINLFDADRKREFTKSRRNTNWTTNIKLDRSDFLQQSGQTIETALSEIAKGKARFAAGWTEGVPNFIGNPVRLYYKQMVAWLSIEILAGGEWTPVFLKNSLITPEKPSDPFQSDGMEDENGSLYLKYIAAPILKLNFEKTTKQGLKSFDFISKYVPDSYSFGSLSYNLLTLRSNQDISETDIPSWEADKDELIMVDQKSEVDTLSSINQINGYYAQVGVNAIYKASLNLLDESDRANYRFGWIWTSLEEWTKKEANSGPTVQEYIKSFVIPSFSTTNGTNEKSYFEVTPSTNNQYILVCFATKLTDTELESATSLVGILNTQINVDPVQTFGVRKSPKETIQDFYDTNKSFVFKNQMFLYGGSNTFFVSDVNNFGYFPMLNNFQIPSDSPIVSIVSFYDSLIIATSRQQFVLSGNSPSTFEINELNNDIGVVAPLTVKNNSNYIFQLTEDGIYKVKTLFNFRDRYNVEKVDDAIKGTLIPDSGSSAVVYQNRYYINIPSKKEIWIYYNDWKAWVSYSSELFSLENMLVIDNELYLISKNGFNIYKFDTSQPDVHGEGSYIDKDMYGNSFSVDSVYLSKEIDYGLPNHDKKLKKLQTRFANTPGQNEVFYTVWVDSTITVDPEKVTVSYDALNNQIIRSTDKKAGVTTTANANFDKTSSTFSGTKNNDGNKYNNDTDQLHEIIVAGRGRQIQFKVEHTQNKTLNIKNFGTLLKVKKPKAQRTQSKRP